MRGKNLSSVLSAVVVAAAVLWSVPAEAQRRGGPRPARVVVASPFYGWSGFYGLGYGYPWYPWGFFGPTWGPGLYRGGSYGSVRVQARPRHAEVFVDGYFAGHVDDFDGAFQRLDLGPGEHEVQIFLDGYRTSRERLYVLPGRSYRIRSTLDKLGAGDPAEARPRPDPPSPDAAPAAGEPAPPQSAGAPPPDFGLRGPRADARAFGRVAVRVQPADAQVLIDGEGWQTAPGQERLIVNLPAGQHRIEVRKPGFDAYNALVDVAPGDTATINVSLTKD